jgi:hypothetical protein
MFPQWVSNLRTSIKHWSNKCDVTRLLAGLYHMKFRKCAVDVKMAASHLIAKLLLLSKELGVLHV